MLRRHVERIKNRLAIGRSVVIAAEVIGRLADRENSPQRPVLAESFTDHECPVIAVRYPHGASENNRTKEWVQTSLSPVMNHQVAGETVHVRLSKEVVAMRAVVVPLNQHIVSHVALEAQHPTVGSRLIHVGHLA